MYCSQCGKKLPENSKFCNECGARVIEKEEPPISAASIELADFSASLGNISHHKASVQPEEPVQMNYDVTSTDNVPMPKISTCIVLGIASALALFLVVITTQIFFTAFVLAALMFVVVVRAWISYIKDYSLAKNDFAQYKKKVLEGRKAAKAAQDELKAKQAAERRKQAELDRKRAEYRAKGIPTCPKCGSTSIATVNRGYSMVSGFIGSGKPVNVCQLCGYKWQIGK